VQLLDRVGAHALVCERGGEQLERVRQRDRSPLVQQLQRLLGLGHVVPVDAAEELGHGALVVRQGETELPQKLLRLHGQALVRGRNDRLHVGQKGGGEGTSKAKVSDEKENEKKEHPANGLQTRACPNLLGCIRTAISSRSFLLGLRSRDSPLLDRAILW